MLQIHLCLVDAECAGFKQFKHKGIASANGGFTPLGPPPHQDAHPVLERGPLQTHQRCAKLLGAAAVAPRCRQSTGPRICIRLCLRVPRRWPDDLADLALDRCPADGPVPCPYCGPVSQRVLRLVPGWHRAHELAVPTNMKLLALPPYSPELNPAEHIWEYLRENEMRNRIFNDLDEVMDAVETSLYHLYQKPETLRSMAAFPWILEAAA